mmetsp:Transcript_18382/g.25900  ORF Transcript_18382/g.25900 Transcript_18382/m.25900 type:complete len:293 (+) Transcript_18382:94-972(+)
MTITTLSQTQDTGDSSPKNNTCGDSSTLKRLDDKRKILETESQAIVAELTSPPEEGVPPMGIDTPLIDSEGYPRADIDVYRARHLRKRLAEIRTDHKLLMKRIEENILNNSAGNIQAEMDAKKAPKPKPKYDSVTGKWVVKNWDGTVSGIEGGEKILFDYIGTLNRTDPNAEPKEEAGNVVSKLTKQNTIDKVSFSLPHFAIVDSVAPDSPAYEAGLKVGDLIIDFGGANETNHRNLKAISEMVTIAASERRSISITISRHGNGILVLNLLPRTWGGRGLLGCFIKIYSENA